MTLFRTVDPVADPVTVAEAKAQLRVNHDSEDALIAGLIRGSPAEAEARFLDRFRTVERARQWIRRAA